MLAVKLLTSNAGQGSVGFGAWPNWNHLPVPEYSIDFSSLAPSASVAAWSVPASCRAHATDARSVARLEKNC